MVNYTSVNATYLESQEGLKLLVTVMVVRCSLIILESQEGLKQSPSASGRIHQRGIDALESQEGLKRS